MVHQQQQQQHRHSSYNYPASHFSVDNKNYQKNNNNNNSSSSGSNVVNDNDTFARLRPQTANNALAPPCGPINGNSAETTDVRWSKLLRHDGTPTKVPSSSLCKKYKCRKYFI